MKKLLFGTLIGLLVSSIGGMGFWVVSTIADRDSTILVKEEALRVAAEETTKLETSITELVKENTKLMNDNTKLVEEKTRLVKTSDELAFKVGELQKVYPARSFKNEKELLDWLGTQPNPPEGADAVVIFRQARDLQLAALKAGYIISAYCVQGTVGYYVGNSAVLEDFSYFWWDPSSDNIYFGRDVRYF